MKRRNILLGMGLLAGLGGSFATLAAPRQARAEAMDIGADERIMGNADAAITIVEYASMTCPHCASFHADILPQLKSAWVDSGKARVVFRHFPLDAVALRASGLAECMAEDRYFGFLDLLFTTQAQWSRSPDPLKSLTALGKQAGLSEGEARACLNDEEVLTAILLQRKEAAEQFEINSTPSLVVNGKKVTGAVSFEKLDAFLKEVEGEGS